MDDSKRLERLVWTFVALGVGLRLLRYLLQFPIWVDEALLAVSLMERDYGALVGPLTFAQIAPVGFLWIQKSVTSLLGFSELSLRLVPALAAAGSVLLMRHVARRLLEGTSMLLAVAIFAVSYYPIRHGGELKPYATDLLVSLALTAIAAEWLRRPERSRWLWIFAAVAPVALLVSYPAVFVAGGIVAALALPVRRRASGAGRLAWLAGGATTVAAFGWTYGFVGRLQSAEFARRNITGFWEGGFPPGDLLGIVTWFLKTHTGRTFGYPIGGDNGGSLVTFVCFVLGAVVLFRRGLRDRLAVLILPFGLAFVAALMRAYPYGGSGRISQYLVPAICLLAGVGVARLVRRRGLRGVVIFLIVFGGLFGLRDLVRPWQEEPDRDCRSFSRWFWSQAPRDAVVVCAREDLELDFATREVWRAGTAVYRVNQRIYFDRLRRGEAPELDAVSRERPLKVAVLGSAILVDDGAGLETWLVEMQERYELIDRERLSFGDFSEDHGFEDWLEVLTFVPR